MNDLNDDFIPSISDRKLRNQREIGHYVVTSHRGGGVLTSVKCSFLSETSVDVIIAKSHRLEVRQLQESSLPPNNNNNQEEPTFPLILSAPINGRIISLLPFRHAAHSTDLLFFTTDTKRFALVCYDPSVNSTIPSSYNSTSSQTNTQTNTHTHHPPYSLKTLASGDLSDYGISIRGRESEAGPLTAIDPYARCIAIHQYDGFITILPILKQPTSHRHNKSNSDYIGQPFHCRIEERTLLSITFLWTCHDNIMPQITFLHQDSRGQQHVISHSVDITHKRMIIDDTTATGTATATAATKPNSRLLNTNIPPPIQARLKKSRVDGGSGWIIPIPPAGIDYSGSPRDAQFRNSLFKQQQQQQQLQLLQKEFQMGGILILGQRVITYHSTYEGVTKSIPIPPSLILTYALIDQSISNNSNFVTSTTNTNTEDSSIRLLIADECGKLYVLVLARNQDGKLLGMHLDLLGLTSVSSSLLYLHKGLIFVGSQFGDSQFLQVLDEPITIEKQSSALLTSAEDKHLSYINILEEYTNLGPIVDFDLVPTTHSVDRQPIHGYRQSMMITASGAGKDGSIRMVRNGVGILEYAAIELSGIKSMWGLRRSFYDTDDSYLVQSYVGETRILGVSLDTVDVDGDNLYDGEESYPTTPSATLEEVQISGFDSQHTTLYAGNIFVHEKSLVIQITDVAIRVVDIESGNLMCMWEPSSFQAMDDVCNLMTVASCNRAAQVVIALRGGILLYLEVQHIEHNFKVIELGQVQLEREISSIDLNPIHIQSPCEMSQSLESIESTTMDADSNMEEVDKSRVPERSLFAVVGLWDDNSVRFLSLHDFSLRNLLQISLGPDDDDSQLTKPENDRIANNAPLRMARSLSLITLESSTTSASFNPLNNSFKKNKVNMLFVGLGDGCLLSFSLGIVSTTGELKLSVYGKKEVRIGTRGISIIPLSTSQGTCVLATGDRPTVIYLAGGSKSNIYNPKLCFSNVNLSFDFCGNGGEDTDRQRDNQGLVINVASSFNSSLLFPTNNSTANDNYFSLCVADESTMRLGTIDDIQKLHVTTHKLGMAPRRVTYFESGHVVCVGCIDDGNRVLGGKTNMGNCIRFFDDTSFEEVDRLDLDPFEMILSMMTIPLKIIRHDYDVNKDEGTIDDYRSYIVVGTAYAYPDEDEPSKGRILILNFSGGAQISADENDIDMSSKFFEGKSKITLAHRARIVAEYQVYGGVYAVCPFYDGSFLATVNSKTRLFNLHDNASEGGNKMELKVIGDGHHGHIISLYVKSLSNVPHEWTTGKNVEQLAIVGDLMRSISLVKYYPKFESIEEIARDFNQNWTTAIEMLTEDIYLGAENFNNLFVLRRNATAKSEELRCRLDTVGVFNLGEMPNKFMGGTLVMPSNSSSSKTEMSNVVNNRLHEKDRDKPVVTVGSQTLFATVDGSIGSVIGLDDVTATFFFALEQVLSRVIIPVGNLKHDEFRSYRGERSQQPTRGFIDGDLVESFLDLSPEGMEMVVREMNKDGVWRKDDFQMMNTDDMVMLEMKSSDTKERKPLTVHDVLAIVEEMTMLH